MKEKFKEKTRRKIEEENQNKKLKKENPDFTGIRIEEQEKNKKQPCRANGII